MTQQQDGNDADPEELEQLQLFGCGATGCAVVLSGVIKEVPNWAGADETCFMCNSETNAPVGAAVKAESSAEGHRKGSVTGRC